MKSRNKKIKLKRIKESVNHTEYKKLIGTVRGDESIRTHTKQNLLRTFIVKRSAKLGS